MKFWKDLDYILDTNKILNFQMSHFNMFAITLGDLHEMFLCG